MKLQQLTVRNFLSWENAKVDLDQQGLVFISGDNGSGKTALTTDAIEWCLFKQISKKIPIGEVQRNGSDNGCKVSLRFRNNGSNYRVDRYRKDKQFGDSVRIYKGKSDITPATMPEAEKRLQRIIGLSRAAFNSLYLFSEESEFYFAAFSDARQKEVLRELLGLSLLEKCRRICSSYVDEIEDEITAQQATVESLRKEIAYLEVRIEEARVEKRTERHDLLKRLTYAEKQEARFKVALDTNRSEIARIQNRENKSVEVQLRIDQRIEELEYGLKGDDSHCSVCNNVVSCDHCESLAVSQKDISDTEKRCAELRVRSERMAGSSRKRANSLRRKSQSLDSYERKLRHYNVEVKTLKKLLKTQEEKSDTKDVDRLREVKQGVEDRLLSIKKLEAQSRRYGFWFKGFSRQGAELFALRQALPVLNKQLRSYLKLMFPSISLEYFVSDKGKIEHTLTCPKLAYRIGGLSKGQKRRIDLCVALSLRNTMRVFTGVDCNLLAMDEVFDGLDKSGVSRAVAMLRSISMDGTSVFVVSHLDALREHFGNVRRVELVDGVSKFV